MPCMCVRCRGELGRLEKRIIELHQVVVLARQFVEEMRRQGLDGDPLPGEFDTLTDALDEL